MEVSCYDCNTTTALNSIFEVKNFVCPNCQSIYATDENGALRRAGKFGYKYNTIGLSLGQKGILKEIEYTVTGIFTKKAYGTYYWREYILKDSSDNFIYLSEADGHWIILNEVEKKYEVSKHPRFLTYNEIRMNLYHYTDVEIVSAQGFFDFEIPKRKVHIIEYISPPYIISIEGIKEETVTFFGEHISKNEIKKAFSILELPNQTGTGLVQPFFFNIKNLAIVFCSTALFILCSHWYIYQEREDKDVFNQNFSFEEFNNKEIITPSFELNGGSAPLTIGVSSDVNNSWANLQVALINEKTNDEVYANKDVEYYHGYTDGESWSEGSSSVEFNICGVTEGKYHLAITPQKAPEDIANNFIQVSATWNQSSMRNVWMIFLFMGILFAIIYFIRYNFEKKRWSESDFTPYEE